MALGTTGLIKHNIASYSQPFSEAGIANYYNYIFPMSFFLCLTRPYTEFDHGKYGVDSNHAYLGHLANSFILLLFSEIFFFHLYIFSSCSLAEPVRRHSIMHAEVLDFASFPFLLSPFYYTLAFQTGLAFFPMSIMIPNCL